MLVAVHAASFTPIELGWPSTWTDRLGRDRTPVVPAHEVSGVVAALGYGTSGLAVGDEVFGLTDWYRDGAAAGYVAIEARNLAPGRPRSTAGSTWSWTWSAASSPPAPGPWSARVAPWSPWSAAPPKEGHAPTPAGSSSWSRPTASN